MLSTVFLSLFPLTAHATVTVNDCSSGDAPAAYITGVTCSQGGGDVCQYDSTTRHLTCEVDRNTSPPWDVYDGYAVFITEHPGSSAQFSVWGNNTDNTNFCCAISAADGDIAHYVLYGSENTDELRFSAGTQTLRNPTGWTGMLSAAIHGDVSADFIHGSTDSVNVLEGLYGGEGQDQIWGYEGGDTLYGDEHDDFLYGGDGDDVIFGGAGEDYIEGNDGDDEARGGTETDTIHGGRGVDTLRGDEGEDFLFGNGDGDFLYGGSERDEISGGPGEDYIYGEDGDDLINGGKDDDGLNGGAGEDEIHGGHGDDTIVGNGDNDTINGDSGDDTISGGSGDDDISGDGGDDNLIGDDGEDLLCGGGHTASGNDWFSDTAGESWFNADGSTNVTIYSYDTSVMHNCAPLVASWWSSSWCSYYSVSSRPCP